MYFDEEKRQYTKTSLIHCEIMSVAVSTNRKGTLNVCLLYEKAHLESEVFLTDGSLHMMIWQRSQDIIVVHTTISVSGVP